MYRYVDGRSAVSPDPAPWTHQRSGVGAAGTIRQCQALEFKRLYFDRPVLVVVESGQKTVRWSKGECTIGCGEGIAVAGGQTIDVVNRPGTDGSYRGRWISWEPEAIARHQAQHVDQPLIRQVQAIVKPGADFVDAVGRAAAAVRDPHLPPAIARHRLAEALLWLGLRCGRFEDGGCAGLAVRIRRLVAQDLGQDWSAAAIASTLALSEPTMRRRLAEEATSLTEILADARLSQALALLQSTELSVGHIALDVGYKTPSHFTASFRKRFGFAPTAIRGPQRAERLASGALA